MVCDCERSGQVRCAQGAVRDGPCELPNNEVNVSRLSLFHRRMGRDVRSWPMLVLLLVVVLVAIGCVLWFMREAMRNEYLAVSEQLNAAYEANLDLVQAQLLERWNRKLAEPDGPDTGPACFTRCVRNGLADSVIALDNQGSIVYPRLSEERNAAANAALFALESFPDRTNERFTNAIAQLRDQVNDYGSNTLSSAQRQFIMHELRKL